MIALDSHHAWAHCRLGLILLRQKGEYAEARELLRRGHELGSKQAGWRRPSAEWVRQAEQAAALDVKLPAILKGEAQPADAAEGLALAGMCATKHLHAAAAHLYAKVFAINPNLADDLGARNRYNAAAQSALAGGGHDKDDHPSGEADKAELRRQALEWLKADLASWAGRMNPDSAATVGKAMASWKTDKNLGGVRSPAALAKLSDEEQAAWQSLWSDIDTLLRQARGD